MKEDINIRGVSTNAQNEAYTHAKLYQFRRCVVRDEGSLLALERDVQAPLAGGAQTVDHLHLLHAGRETHSHGVIALGTQTFLAGDAAVALLAHASVNFVSIKARVLCVIQVCIERLEVGNITQRRAKPVPTTYSGDVCSFWNR